MGNHLHVSGDGAAIQNVMAIDDRVCVYTSAVLVKASFIGEVAETDDDAVGGSQLPAVDVEFALQINEDAARMMVLVHVRDTPNIVVAPVLDELSRPRESAHVDATANAQGAIGKKIGSREYYVAGKLDRVANIQRAIVFHL